MENCNASMPDSASESVSQSRLLKVARHPNKRLWPFALALSTVLPVLAALFAYHIDSFDPAPMPIHELTQSSLSISFLNDNMLKGAEFVGSGELPGPEDIAYDSELHLIYTGCLDGWIKRVRLNDSESNPAVEKWVNTHGRPLGMAIGHNGEAIVADGYKGLLNISRDGDVEVLTHEADGLKFKIPNGVDIAENGVIYFTDASYKYSVQDNLWDVLEGKPHGRFMSFDPVTKRTTVLVNDLYFPNGVAVSPTQDSVILCETIMKRCRRYYIQGNKQGELENFIDGLPGLPDNIKYDGDGHYWIALAMGDSALYDLAMRYAFIRKVMGMMEKYIGGLPKGNNAGVLVVDLKGKPVAHYYDHKLCSVTSAMKIGNRLYCGSAVYSHIISLNLDQHPARPTVFL